MSRRREPTEEERALFRDALKDAVPIEPAKAGPRVKSGAAKAKVKAPAPRGASPPAGKPTGLDGRTGERLRKGVLEPEARIDLHGMTEAVAHRALITFIRAAAMRDCRLVLVVTGKGLKAPEPHEPFDLELVARRRGVLKAMAPRWLAEPELAGFVADLRPAHRKHGGEGALYVYLRKRR